METLGSDPMKYLGYTTGSYTMKFYTCDDKGEFTDCFSQANVGKTQLIKTFTTLGSDPVKYL